MTSAERIEVVPINQRAGNEAVRKTVGPQYDPILYEIRQLAMKIRAYVRRENKLDNFESTNASDPDMRPDSMIESMRLALLPIIDKYKEDAIAWYESEDAETIKAQLVFDYREELQPDGSIKATGRPAYPSPKQKKVKTNPLDGLDKDMLLKLIQAEMSKR